MLEAVGVGLLVAVPLLGPDFVLVERTDGHARDEEFPDPPCSKLHGVVTSIPGVEVADDPDTHGMGCPETEHHTRDSVAFAAVGAHPLPNVVMVAFCEEMAIHLTHPFATERPGVVLLVGDSPAQHPHPVVGSGVLAQGGLKHPGVMGTFHHQLLAMGQKSDGVGLRHPDPDGGPTIHGLWPENRVGMVVSALSEAMSVLHHPVEDCGHAHEIPDQWARACGIF